MRTATVVLVALIAGTLSFVPYARQEYVERHSNDKNY